MAKINAQKSKQLSSDDENDKLGSLFKTYH